MWINTKVEFEWDGEKYVEVHSEGYEYSGDIDYAQVIPTMGASYSPPGGGGGGGTSPQGSQGPWSDDPAFFEWFMGTYPNMDWDSLSEQQQNAYWTSYQDVTAETGGDDVVTEDVTEAGNWWDAYAGDNDFLLWLVNTKGMRSDAFKNLSEAEGTQLWNDYQTSLTGDTTGDTTGEDDPNAPEQVGDKWMDSAGNLWASSEEAYASNVRIRQLEEKRLGRMADYERRFTEYKELMAKGTAEERSLAQRLSARAKGELKRDVRSAMLGMGETIPEGFEERLEESSTRNLLDMMSNIEQRNIARLTAAKQFEIGTDMSLDQIALQEEGMEKQMYQFLSTQAQREAQFEGTMGMQQAELALRKQLGLGQLDLGRDQFAEGQRQFDLQLGYQLTPEQQMKMAKWGAYGQLGGSIVGAFGGKIWDWAKQKWG